MAGNVREIAAKANVSIATVSRVLHQAENVKAETREKVEEAMKEMGLIPEDLIRSAKRDGRTVGVLIPDLTNSFFADVIQGIEERAEQMGMKVVICHTKDSDRTEIQYLRLMKELQVAGIIITPVSDDDDNVNNEYLNLLSNMKIPVVLVDRDVKYTGHAGVFIDNEYGAFEATKLLLENGHSNIALIAGPTNTVPGRGRRKGYQDAFKFMNIPVREELIFNGDFSITSGKLITRHILADYPDVTAIFSCNNHMTLGCISELMEVGKKIPDDMALVGFDDLPLVKILHYQLTVVDRSSREMGYQAMKLMSKMLKGGKSGVEQRIILTPKLIVRVWSGYAQNELEGGTRDEKSCGCRKLCSRFDGQNSSFAGTGGDGYGKLF